MCACAPAVKRLNLIERSLFVLHDTPGSAPGIIGYLCMQFSHVTCHVSKCHVMDDMYTIITIIVLTVYCYIFAWSTLSNLFASNINTYQQKYAKN